MKDVPDAKFNYRLIPLDFTLQQLSRIAEKYSADEEILINSHKDGGWFYYVVCECCNERRAERYGSWCKECEDGLERHQNRQLNDYLDRTAPDEEEGICLRELRL